MNLAEYTPKQYLLIELPYSKIIMNAPEAIGLDKPVGAFIVPEAVWRRMKSDYTLNQMKLSGEMVSTLASDGVTEWLSLPDGYDWDPRVGPRQSIRAKHVSSTSRVSKLIQSPRVIEGLGSNESCTKSDTHWTSMREDGLKIETEEHLS